MDAAAAALTGAEPRLPSHHLLQIGTAGEETLRAISLLQGFGVALQIFTRETPDNVLERLTEQLRSTVPRNV